MKKLFGLVLSGILMSTMVGCTDSVEKQVEEQEPPTVEEPKEDEYVEPEEVIEEPEVTKEEVAYLIKMAIQENMSSRYEVEVLINEDGSCAIGIADTQMSYSGYTKDEMEAMAKQAGLDVAAKDFVDNAINVFYEYGYEDIIVTLVLTGNDYVPFMMINNTGRPVYL